MKKIIKLYNHSLLNRSLIAATDQALLSIVSFLISVFLIKYVSKYEYGFYSIGFSIILFIISIQNAIINTPLAVLLINKKGKEKDQYSTALCYGQYIGIIPAFCFGITLLIGLSFIGLDSNKVLIGCTICLASIGILLREYMRALFFAEENTFNVLKLDIVYIIIYLVVVAASFVFYRIDAVMIFLSMGLSGFLVGAHSILKKKWKFNKKFVRKSLSENWVHGKWSLFGVIVTHIQTYSYIYILGLLIGSSAVADISAARLLMQPLILLEAGWIKVVIPHGSKLREEKKFDRFFKEQILVSCIFVICIILYVLTVSSFSNVLEKFLLSEKYRHSLNYIFLWGIIFSFNCIGFNARYGLLVAKKFDTVFKITFVTMLITVLIAYFLIKNQGITGALNGLIISRALSAIILWFYFTKNSLSIWKTYKSDKYQKNSSYRLFKKNNI